jgi:hypothetical protein
MDPGDVSDEYAERAYHAFFCDEPHAKWNELSPESKSAWYRVVAVIGDSIDGIYEEC